MTVITACVFAIISSSIILIIRSFRPEYTLPLSIATAIGLTLICIDSILSLNTAVSRLFENINSAYIKILLKAAGVCIISRVTSDICKDSGLTSVSARIDSVCRLSLCALAIPLILEVVDLITKICGV